VASKEPTRETSIEITFDSIRAVKAGADDHGMQQYVIVVLKKCANRGEREEATIRL